VGGTAAEDHADHRAGALELAVEDVPAAAITSITSIAAVTAVSTGAAPATTATVAASATIASAAAAATRRRARRDALGVDAAQPPTAAVGAGLAARAFELVLADLIDALEAFGAVGTRATRFARAAHRPAGVRVALGFGFDFGLSSRRRALGARELR
jgi:hypothetical protein